MFAGLWPSTSNFYPRPPRGGRRPLCLTEGILSWNFYPRPPRGGRHASSSTRTTSFPISIHALREEGDPQKPAPTSNRCYFYPRPPRGGRPLLAHSAQRAHFISIHALREEGDSAWTKTSSMPCNFYPRPPRGGRQMQPDAQTRIAEFLSTPSARRATQVLHLAAVTLAISIHALREEGDMTWDEGTGEILVISIHALREEGDVGPAGLRVGRADFYPRPPRGGRHGRRLTSWGGVLFLSTPSARRATGAFSYLRSPL